MDGKWVHNPPSAEVKEAFESLQQSLTEDLILHRPDFDKPFHLWIDAAQKIGGCGAILAQMDGDKQRVISFWSVRWIDSPANWAPVEHECYAFRRAAEKWYEYLSHAHFVVHTDSEPLVWMQSLRRPKGHMAKWIMEMQALDFEVVHLAGKDNIASDALSRLALERKQMEADRRQIALNAESPFSVEMNNDHVSMDKNAIDQGVHANGSAKRTSFAESELAYVTYKQLDYFGMLADDMKRPDWCRIDDLEKAANQLYRTMSPLPSMDRPIPFDSPMGPVWRAQGEGGGFGACP